MFSNDLQGYFAIPIDVAGQTEEKIKNVISLFETNYFKLTLDNDDEGDKFPEFKDKTFIVCRNFNFFAGSDNFKILNRRKAELTLIKQINKNLESLIDINSAIIFFTNKNLSSQSDDLSTTSIKDENKSYAIVPIGPEPNSDDDSKAFITPPYIRQVSIVRGTKDVFDSNPTLQSNTFLNTVLQKIQKEISESDDLFLGDFKSYIGSSENEGSNKGQTIYMPKKSKYFMVVFNANPDKAFWKRKYKISIGNSGIGFGKFGGGIRIFSDVINGLGVFIYKNIKPIGSGFSDVRISTYDSKYKVSYDSTLVRKHTIKIPLGNYSEDQETKEIILTNKSVSSKSSDYGDKNVFLNYFLDYNYLPYNDQFVLPNDGVSDIDTVAKFTTAVRITPDTTISFFGFPSALSEEANSDNIKIKKSEDLYSILVNRDGTINIDLSNVAEDTKNKIAGAISEAAGLGENISIDNIASLDLDSLSLDIEVNPLSSLTNFLSNIKDSIEDVVNNASFNNEFVALKTSEIEVDRIAQGNYFIDNEEQCVKGIITIRYDNYSSVRARVPRVAGLKKKSNNKIIPKGEFSETKLNVGEEYELLFEDFNPKTSNVEINGVEILDKTRDSVSFSLSSENKSVVNATKNIVSPNNPCQAQIGVSTENVLWTKLRDDVSNVYSNILGRDDKFSQYGGNAFDNVLGRYSPSNYTQIQKDKIADFCDKHALDFIGEKICGGGLLNTIKSFCDFSFHATIELSLELKSFKKLLVVIKVIFCIIDVLCALMNPKKLAFALVRLFLCLYDLLLLLPQISVPVMALKLFLHLLELLKCVIDKVLGIVKATNEIVDALTKAIELKNLAAIKNLEAVLERYLLTLELDLAILDPIIQLISQFLELLEFLFRFPCRVGAGDDLGVLCLESSMLAGFVAAKIAPQGFIETQYLIPVAQTYTTLSEDDAALCGNTPSENADDGDSRATLLRRSGNTNCDFGSGIMERPSENLGSTLVTKTSDQTFNDAITVVTDEEKLLE